MSYYYPVHVRLQGASTTEDAVTICFHERMEILGAKIVDVAGVTANASNYAVIKVLGNDQTTSMYQWSTASAAEGSLTANESEDLVSQGEEALAVFDAGEAVMLELSKASSGVTVDCVVALHCRQARSY